MPYQAKISPEMSVDALLSAYPRLAEVFIAQRMACVGCTVSGFHTLAQAAAIYGIELAVLMSELQDKLALMSSSLDK